MCVHILTWLCRSVDVKLGSKTFGFFAENHTIHHLDDKIQVCARFCFNIFDSKLNLFSV